MPVKPPSICGKTGCGVKTHGRYCDAHRQEQSGWASRNKHSNKTTTQRGYGYAWEKKKKRIIERDKALCQPCMREGKYTAFHAVDHIVHKDQGGTDDDHNLQCICKRHHDIKTHRESNMNRSPAGGGM